MTDLISVVVSTFNREDALGAVLRSLSRQSDREFEVVVADDGSGPATEAMAEQWRSRLGVTLVFVRHEKQGFRLAEIRNRAIRASAGAYCVFLDGDCLVPPDYIAMHRHLAERGWFVTGNRALLSQAMTIILFRPASPNASDFWMLIRSTWPPRDTAGRSNWTAPAHTGP